MACTKGETASTLFYYFQAGEFSDFFYALKFRIFGKLFQGAQMNHVCIQGN